MKLTIENTHAFIEFRLDDSISTIIHKLDQWFSKCGLRPAASTSFGHLLEKQIIRPNPDLLNQKLWEWTQQSVF